MTQMTNKDQAEKIGLNSEQIAATCFPLKEWAQQSKTGTLSNICCLHDSLEIFT
jgi:hypothetical protein